MVFTTEMDITKPKARVNGSQLSGYNGKGVCVIGNASNASQDGMSFSLTATDGVTITVRMNQPIQEYMEGLVEVQGVVSGQNSIQCAHYVKFAPETVDKFDMDSYNKAMEFINQNPDHYIQGAAAS